LLLLFILVFILVFVLVFILVALKPRQLSRTSSHVCLSKYEADEGVKVCGGEGTGVEMCDMFGASTQRKNMLEGTKLYLEGWGGSCAVV